MTHLAAPVTPEQNKETVRAFYQAAIVDKDFDAARKLVGDDYAQHNPLIADGIDGLEAFIGQLRETFPDLHVTIKRLLADGDTWSGTYTACGCRARAARRSSTSSGSMPARSSSTGMSSRASP